MNIIYFFIVSTLLIIIYFVRKRPSQQPSDIEVYNQALKAIIDNNHEKAFKILKNIIAKDSNNTEAYLLLGNLLRDRDINKATKIHQTIIVRPKLSKELKVQIHQALGLDYLELGNTVRAEDEFKKMLDIDSKFLSRSLNEGFSGGEKKRNEIFQMAMLEPSLAILDETDSGLDIDALKIVANGVNKLKSKDNAVIIITHYQRLLDHIVPDFVHVLFDGKIVKSGTKELAHELEAKGYDWIKELA